MTISGVFAARQGEHVPDTVVGVYADSRLTLHGGLDHRDGVEKLFPISSRTCATVAGRVGAFLTALPEATMAVQEQNDKRPASGQHPMSLWQESGTLFRHVLEKRRLLDERAALCVLVAGFLSNGDPAIAEARFGGPWEIELHLHKPSAGEVVSRVAGVIGAVRVVADAVRISVSRNCAMDALAGVLHDLIKSELPGIGGGISYGLCRHSDDGFAFPVCVIGRSAYRRGVVVDARDAAPVVKFRHQMGLLRRLMREDAKDPKFHGGAPTASLITTPSFCKGYPEMFMGEEPSWVSDLSLEVPELLWVGQPGSRQGNGFRATMINRASGLHPRDVASVDHHRRGKPLPPPTPADAVTPPSAPGELVWEFRLDTGTQFGPLPRPDDWDWKAS